MCLLFYETKMIKREDVIVCMDVCNYVFSSIVFYMTHILILLLNSCYSWKYEKCICAGTKSYYVLFQNQLKQARVWLIKIQYIYDE